jgi:circadian clock protein KaiC
VTAALLPTGDPGLDAVVGGGLRPGALIVVAGAPGTGKTILAQQLAFRNATPDRKAVYFTTWSEPHDKLVEHLSGFAFFDRSALAESVEFVDVADLASGDGGIAAVSDEIVRKAFADRPAVIVLDSSKALAEVGGEGYREAVYNLASRVALTGALLLLVGEYTPAQIEESPEFAVADGIVQIANESRGPVDLRWLRVLKLRGADPLPGRHSVGLSARGFSVFPRLETTPQPAVATEPGRASFALARLDERLGGGLPHADATLVLGPSGVGKTVLALRFLTAGLEAGEHGLYVSFQETGPQLAAKAAALGWPIDDALADGRLVVHHIPPVEVDLDAAGAAVRDLLAASDARRVVVDSLAELAFAARETERFAGYVWALTGYMRGAGATSLFTNETAALGPVANPAGGLSLLFNNVLLLRYLERDSQIHRALAILKMRNSPHAKGLVEFGIGDGGLAILDELKGVTGVLGWTALRSEDG